MGPLRDLPMGNPRGRLRGTPSWSCLPGVSGSPHALAPQPDAAVVLEAWSLSLVIQLIGSV